MNSGIKITIAITGRLGMPKLLPPLQYGILIPDDEDIATELQQAIADGLITTLAELGYVKEESNESLLRNETKDPTVPR